MAKYKITPGMLEETGGIHRLEHDGIGRAELHNQMYKLTDGASASERRKIMNKLYTRDTDHLGREIRKLVK